MRRQTRWAFGVLVLLWSLIALPGLALASAGVTSTTPLRPPTSTFGLRAGFYGATRLEHNHFTYAVPRGATVHDSIDVFSLSDKPVTVKLYPADLVVAQGGALTPAQQSAPRKDAGAWITLSRSSLTLRPRQVVAVPFTVRVPGTATPGQHAAAVVGSTLLGRTSSGLSVETRVALQAIVTVKGKIHLGLTMDQPHLDAGHVVTVTIHNTGNVLLTLRGRTNLDGVTANLGPADLYVIPGGEATLTGHFDGIPWIGHYQLTAHVDAALDRRPVGSYAATAGLWFVPWRFVTSALVLVVLAAAAWRLTRPRRLARRMRRREEKAVLSEFRATRGGA